MLSLSEAPYMLIFKQKKIGLASTILIIILIFRRKKLLVTVFTVIISVVGLSASAIDCYLFNCNYIKKVISERFFLVFRNVLNYLFVRHGVLPCLKIFKEFRFFFEKMNGK